MILTSTREKEMQTVFMVRQSRPRSFQFLYSVLCSMLLTLLSFLGCIPDDAFKRSIMFLVLILMSSVILLIRSIGIAMLLIFDRRYATWFYICDFGFFSLFKILRGDFLYWIPIDFIPPFLVALILRVIVKSICDFTALIHFRNPCKLVFFCVFSLQIFFSASLSR